MWEPLLVAPDVRRPGRIHECELVSVHPAEPKAKGLVDQVVHLENVAVHERLAVGTGSAGSRNMEAIDVGLDLFRQWPSDETAVAAGAGAVTTGVGVGCATTTGATVGAAVGAAVGVGLGFSILGTVKAMTEAGWTGTDADSAGLEAADTGPFDSGFEVTKAPVRTTVTTTRATAAAPRSATIVCVRIGPPWRAPAPAAAGHRRRQVRLLFRPLARPPSSSASLMRLMVGRPNS